MNAVVFVWRHPREKAAARLTASLGAALRELPLTDEQKKRIPDDASTLHRLWGLNLVANACGIMQETRCIAGVLVVDEASMICR